jgi:hypothetical protein
MAGNPLLSAAIVVGQRGEAVLSSDRQVRRQTGAVMFQYRSGRPVVVVGRSPMQQAQALEEVDYLVGYAGAMTEFRSSCDHTIANLEENCTLQLFACDGHCQDGRI